MKHFVFSLIIILSCFNLLITNKAKAAVTLTIGNYNDWGWECLVIENGYIELVIVPEIGARIMRYAFPNDQQMAINPSNIGEKYDLDKDTYGPWGKGYGYEGFKNWPAPQTFWNWPPPPTLDWGLYTYEIEHQSADSLIIYFESEVETKLASGLKQARRIKVYSNSTLVNIEQYLINVSAKARELSVWDVTQTIVQHDKDNDLENFSVYFSAEAKNISNEGNKLNISEVAENIHRFADTKKSSKAYINLLSGWCANVDERDHQSYFKLFEIDPKAKHPDDNSNFEIYSSGNHDYIEIEVLSPLKRLEQGDTLRYDQFWSASHTSGIHYNANTAGSVLKPTVFDSNNSKISGKYTAFTSGTIKAFLFNNGKQITELEGGSVEAGMLFNIDESLNVSSEIDSVAIIAFDLKGTPIGAIDNWTAKKVGFEQFKQNKLSVYPTVISGNEPITLQLTQATSIEAINLISLSGKSASIIFENKKETKWIDIEVPTLKPGIYCLNVQTPDGVYYQKIIIK